MIKFEHSVFALPFALTGALLAFRESGFRLRQQLGWKLLWIVVAMVGARSAAMAFNRLVDAEIDARNPRTKMRHIPAGTAFARHSPGASSLVVDRALPVRRVATQSAVLPPGAAGAGASFSPIRLPSASPSSRTWCWASALGIAPAAAWIAVRGSLDPRILWLTAAVTFWTAGFDIIYSCQDYEFDCDLSFTACRRLGIARALRIAQAASRR